MVYFCQLSTKVASPVNAVITVMILSFRTVQTQIRLLLLDKIPYSLADLFEFQVHYSKVFLASENLGILR